MRHMMIASGTSLRNLRESIGLSQAKLAELAGISQHIISAYELEKTGLQSHHLEKLSSVFSDGHKIAEIVGRKKRYRTHTYNTVNHDISRVGRSEPTKGNAEYVKLINSHTHNSKNDRNHKAISLFAGCGGLSLGFSQAGFDIKGFIEIDKGLGAIYNRNFPGVYKIGTDITKITRDEISCAVELIGPVDVIIGGPPCQGFSLAGKRDVDDPRNSLFRHYLRFVDAFKPRIAVMENVKLLTSMKSPNGGFVRDEIRREFDTHGYNAEIFTVNAKDYGVPQHRERVIFIATEKGIKSKKLMPDAMYGDIQKSGFFDEKLPYRTFGDACSDLAFLESGDSSKDPMHVAVNHPQHVIDWLWNVKEGYSAHENENVELRPPSGYNTTYKRQVWSEPAATVQTTFGMISGCRNVHPIATRSLTIREAARIQSFPDNFDFSGNLGSARTGIGNAVPPLLAYLIAKHLKKLL